MTKVATTIGTLVMGQVLLAAARKVAGGKLQLTFAEMIENPKQSSNILAMLNADDDRFKASQKGARRAFLTATPAMALQFFGIKAEELTEDDKEINILNPAIGGKALRLQVTESHKGTEYEMANPAKCAKQYTDNNGVKHYFIKDGELIFSATKVVDCEPKHTIISSDVRVTWDAYVANKVSAVSSVEESLNA